MPCKLVIHCCGSDNVNSTLRTKHPPLGRLLDFAVEVESLRQSASDSEHLYLIWGAPVYKSEQGVTSLLPFETLVVLKVLGVQVDLSHSDVPPQLGDQIHCLVVWEILPLLEEQLLFVFQWPLDSFGFLVRNIGTIEDELDLHQLFNDLPDTLDLITRLGTVDHTVNEIGKGIQNADV